MTAALALSLFFQTIKTDFAIHLVENGQNLNAWLIKTNIRFTINTNADNKWGNCL